MTEIRHSLTRRTMSCGIEAAHEHHGAVDERRDVGGHGLPEQVAERQQVEEAQRQEGPGIRLVLGHFLRDRHEVGQQVLVANDDALGLRRGAGREHDLGDVVARDRSVRHRAVGAPIELVEGPNGERGFEGAARGRRHRHPSRYRRVWRRRSRRRARQSSATSGSRSGQQSRRQSPPPSSRRAIPRSSRPRAASCRPRPGRRLPGGVRILARRASPARR